MNFGALGVRSHLILTVITVVVLGFGAMYIVAGQLFENSIRADREDRAAWTVGVVARDVGRYAGDRGELNRLVADWAKLLYGGCLGVFDGAGAPVGSTRDELLRCVGEGQLPTVASGAGTHWLSSAAGSFVAVGIPVPPGEARDALGGGLVVYAARLADVEQRVAAIRTLILLFMTLAVVLVSGLGYVVLTQLIVGPLSRLRRAFGRVEAGELDVLAAPEGGRELRELAEAFNALTAYLRADEKRIGHQISELKLINDKLEQARDSLVRSEKLASVGKLAAGVAHEIGNPISIVVGYLEMMRRPDCTEEERATYLEQCVEAVGRISAIIRDLLDFSRPERGHTGTADVRRVVDQSVALMGPQKPFKQVRLSVQIAEGGASRTLVAAIEERRLQQVLVNLLMNAADACVAAPETTDAVISVVVDLDAEGQTILIRVVDNGPGISPEIQARIFDPFYTTKEPGRGTGLGLAISYSIVSASGGDIRLDTKVGEGTCFTLVLPIANAG